MASTNTLGKYEIIREIARSNDVVYEAMDPSLGRRVALKELYLAPNLTGAQKRERIERFLREGKAAGQLAHPNIVTVYDVGQEGDRFFIAMEFLEGQTLRDTMQVRGAMPVQEAVDIITQLCDALGYAHSHNVVHRDVKPENVQILPSGHVKLTDFGIARIMSEPSITQDGQVFGTPSYMSPEQVSGKQIDGRSDIFSLGVMLYEMLAGHKPFTGDTVVTITYNIMNSEPAPIPGVPPGIMAAINRAMSKDPNGRFSTVEQLVDQLKNPPSNGSPYYSDPYASAPASSYGQSQSYSPPPPPPPTTYGPSSYSPGQIPRTSQSVPDPFSHAPSVPPPPPIPRQPIMSGETKTFLGVLLLVIGLAGMLVFAIWVTTQAYDKYADTTAGAVVDKYIAQGNKLYNDGKYDAAIDQYKSAVSAAGKTKSGERARRSLATAYAEAAKRAYDAGDYARAAEQATSAVQADPTASSGHYWLAVTKSYLNQRDAAEQQFKETLDKGGNDEFAIDARKRLSQMLIADGDVLKSQSNTPAARKKYQEAIDLQDPEWAPKAQDALNALGG